MTLEAEAYLTRQAQHIVNTRNMLPLTPEQKRKFTVTGIFLERVKNIYDINSIYYPGCSSENILESAFTPDQIYYLDKNIRRTDAPHAIIGDYLHPPFPFETFDALFLNDIHLHEFKSNLRPKQALQQVLSSIKKDGLVIVGKRRACPEWPRELKFYTNQSELSPVSVPMQHPDFELFLNKKRETRY